MKSGSKLKKNQRRTVPRKAEVEMGSGNVFADLDLPQPAELLARAQLVGQISVVIAQRRLTQAQAAAILGIDQPKVSALLRGKLAGFSTDRLFRFLNALGRDVEIVIRTPARRRGQGGVRVLAAG